MPPATNGLSRGHLSRPACSHVKQLAKRPGTREPGRDISPAGFLLAKGGRYARVVQDLPSRNPPGSCRHAALAVRRDLGGVVSHPRLRLPDGRGMRGPLLRQDPGLRLFALLEPDHEHVRTAHGGVRRCGGGAFDRDRNGGGDDGNHGPRARRRSCGRGQGVVRLVPLGHRGMAAAFRRHIDAGQRHRSRRVEKGDAEKHQGVFPGIPDQSHARSDRHRRGRRDRPWRRRETGRRQRLCHPAVPEPAQAGRRLRGLFGDQAHRRPGPRPWAVSSWAPKN